MVEDGAGEGLPNLASLVLQAKYGSDEPSCRAAGEKVVESLREHGRYSAMIDLSIDEGTPPFLSEEARKNILAAAIAACNKSGTLLPLEDLATRQDVALEIAEHAGVSLALRCSAPYQEAALWSILKDVRYPDRARAEAGMAIVSHAESLMEFSALFRLSTEQGIIYEVRKPAGLALIRLAVDAGNYPVLLTLNGVKPLPVDILIALEDKVEEAAKAAIELAYAEGDAVILKDISEDSRLAASIRGRAMGCLHDCTHPAKAPDGGQPDPQMTAELMYRLGKGAGAVRSSIEPPPSPAHAPDKALLSRLKR